MNATTSPRTARPSVVPDLSLVGVTMLWGGTFLTVQTALQWSGAFGFVAMRFGVAGLLALCLCGRMLARLNRAELRAGIIIGSVLFASYSLQTLGLPHIASSTSAFLTALYVPLVPLMQWGLFRQRPSLAAWGGIAVAFTGLLLLAQVDGSHLQLGMGEWLTLGGAAAIALEICLVGRYAHACDPRRVAVVQLLTVALLSACAMLFSGEALPQAEPLLLLAVLVMGAVTALIQIVMNWAQKTVPATRATIIYAMEPVWAGLVGYVAGELLSVSNVTGAALIVASVLLSQLGGRRQTA